MTFWKLVGSATVLAVEVNPLKLQWHFSSYKFKAVGATTAGPAMAVPVLTLEKNLSSGHVTIDTKVRALERDQCSS